MPQSRKSRHVPGGGGGGGYDGNNNNNNNNNNNANGANNMNVNDEPLVQQPVNQGQILPANPFIQGQVAAIPPNPQPLWAGIQIPQFNPQPAAGLGAALAAQGNANHIPPPLIIPNLPNFNFGNPQGRKRKSRKHKSRKNKSRKHKSNRR